MPGFFRNEENITLYDKAFLPVSTTIGTPYTCNQKDIDLLFQGRARLHHDIPVFKNFITRDEATAKLERFSHSCSLDLPDENKEAVDKLKRLVGDGLPTIWGPDIVFKCFKDLDRVFFKGRLTGYTKLAWVNSADMNIRVPSGSTVFACSGCCGMLGTTWTKAYASIQLNAENIYLMETCSFTTPEEGSHRFRVYGCFRFMLGILLHEMVHTYLFIGSGHATGKERLKDHGPCFQRCLYTVDKHADALLGIRACADYHEDWDLFDCANHVVEPKVSWRQNLLRASCFVKRITG